MVRSRSRDRGSRSCRRRSCSRRTAPLLSRGRRTPPPACQPAPGRGGRQPGGGPCRRGRPALETPPSSRRPPLGTNQEHLRQRGPMPSSSVFRPPRRCSSIVYRLQPPVTWLTRARTSHSLHGGSSHRLRQAAGGAETRLETPRGPQLHAGRLPGSLSGGTRLTAGWRRRK